MVSLTIRSRNFQQVAAKLQDRERVIGSLADVFTRGGQLLEHDVEQHRPSDGALRAISPFQTHIDAKSASVSVGSLKPYDVARALNYGRKFHYSRGPFAGKPTAGWFTEAPKRVRAAVRRLISRAAKTLESQMGTD